MKKRKKIAVTSPLLKALVLSLFVLLIISFIAYRSGYFDKTPITDLNSFNEVHIPKLPSSDTLVPIDSHLIKQKKKNEQLQRMYGSKSGVIVDSKTIHPKMSSSKYIQVLNLKDLGEDSTTLKLKPASGYLGSDDYATSSKSGPVFNPNDQFFEDLFIIKSDSNTFQQDSSKK